MFLKNQREIEFNTLKAALFKDLENRCQKVVELEMLLDEARDQYQSLLVQVKNSNTSALQRKCIFLQKNLEQLTKVQQEVIFLYYSLIRISNSNYKFFFLF